MGIKIVESKGRRKPVVQLNPGDVFEQGGRYYLVTDHEPFCLETGCAWQGTKDMLVEVVNLELRKV